jgi:hypothetical protein
MIVRLIPCVLTCGPLVITIAAWTRLYQKRQGRQHALGLVALGVVTANAAFAAATFLYYELRPPSHFLPPWQDPEILQLGLLFLLAPISMILGVVNKRILGAFRADSRGGCPYVIYFPANSFFTASLTTLPSTRMPAALNRAMAFFITVPMSFIVGDTISAMAAFTPATISSSPAALGR